MELLDFLKAIMEHNEKGGSYQIHLNSGNLDDRSDKNNGIEFSDLYFSDCQTLQNTRVLCFDNSNCKPVAKKEDGTDLYPMNINSTLFIELEKIEAIEEVKDYEDWFEYPSTKVINLYMIPENNDMDGHRNVLSVGFCD